MSFQLHSFKKMDKWQMHTQTIKCVFNRIGMPKLLGLVKFSLKDSVLFQYFFKK